MHWCVEEQMALMALLAMIPFIGPWLRAKLSRKQDCPCGHEGGERHV